MNQSCISLKKAATILFNNDFSKKVNKNVNWSELLDIFNESIEISQSTWTCNYGSTFHRIINFMQVDYPLLKLTDRGMVFVGEGLFVSANSSNSSIPSVTPTDLKE